MAKSKKVTRRKKGIGFSIPLAVVSGFAPLGMVLWPAVKARNMSWFLDEFGKSMTGYSTSKGFQFGALKNGLLPITLGALAHAFIGGKLGLNRVIARSGIPLIRF